MVGLHDLRHYSICQIEQLHPLNYRQSDHFKPCGFWLSVGTAWKDWCVAEYFHTHALAVTHHVELVESANVLRLSGTKDIDAFTREFGIKNLLNDCIRWKRVADLYQGIIIAPYCYERRLAMHCGWYYGWDCASGCVWDVAAIQNIGVMEAGE